MNNFDLKNYLANNVLLKEEDNQWDLTGYQYPQEIRDMDKKVEELKTQFLELQSRLEAAKRARNKAKSDFTKTLPSLKDQDEFKDLPFQGRGYGKQKQYMFKKIVDSLRKISEKSGNDWETLEKELKAKFGNRLTIHPEESRFGRALYVDDLFFVATADNYYFKQHPEEHIKIGDWYVTLG